ncbi:MAG: hypothetical protein IJM88_04010 [Bacteroidales bacterium]|nr:hypothetical protein [Bacteroidales bacterium]
MNTDTLIEQLHQANAAERQKECKRHLNYRPWWLAVPAAAAIALLVLVPMHSKAEPKPVTGLHVYCNNNCKQETALEIIQQNINDIRSATIESEL